MHTLIELREREREEQDGSMLMKLEEGVYDLVSP